jgi:hypothetical protein
MLIKLVTILVLLALNFALQNTNFITLNWNDCNYYTYNSECATVNAYIANKTIRLFINIFSIYKILPLFHLPTKKINVLIALVSIFIVFIIDLIFSFSGNHTLINFHKVINPLLYSPLTQLVLIAFYFSKSIK